MKTIAKAVVLDQLEAQVESHLQLVTRSFQNLNRDLLVQPAGNGGWSIAQCLEHLNSYGRYYLPAITKGIQQSANSPGSATFKSTWLGDYFTRMMQPGSSSRKLKAPKNHTPAPDLDARNVIAVFIEQQEMMLSLIRKARMSDLNKVRIPISISRWIRLKLGDVFQFLTAHNERHLSQAQRHLLP